MPNGKQLAYNPKSDAEHVAQGHQAVRTSREILVESESRDTFLGRKTQEPFPKQETDKPAWARPGR